MTKADLEEQLRISQEKYETAVGSVGELDEELGRQKHVADVLREKIDGLRDKLEARDRAIMDMDRQRLVVVAFLDAYFQRNNLMVQQLEGESQLCEPFSKLSCEETVMLCRCLYDIMLSTSTVEGLMSEASARGD